MPMVTYVTRDKKKILAEISSNAMKVLGFSSKGKKNHKSLSSFNYTYNRILTPVM